MIKNITRSHYFIKQTKKLDSFQLKKLKKQIEKIITNPNVGKPLQYKMGEQTIYIKPFRLIYALNKDELILLKFEHRKTVYK